MKKRTEESKIAEIIIDGKTFVKTGEGPIFPNHNLYCPREFDWTAVSAQIAPQDKTDYVIRANHEGSNDNYEIYKLKN